MNDTHDDGHGGNGHGGEGWPVPDSVAGRLALLRALTGKLANEDWAGLPAAVQDQAIRAFEAADAAQAAARGAALAGFAGGDGLASYGHQATTPYLTAETNVTKGAARVHGTWARRHRQHPLIMQALARQDITCSAAARICQYTGLLPAGHRAMADQILLNAWLAGCGEAELAMLAAQMRAELDPDHDTKPPEPGVRVDTTIGGAGVIRGDLSPGVTALVRAAFAKYAVRQGPDDHRTLAERQHEALGHICREILSRTGQLLPRPGTIPAGDDDGAKETDSPTAAGHDSTVTPDPHTDTPAGGSTDQDTDTDIDHDGSTHGHDSETDEEEETDDGLFAAPATTDGTGGTASNGTGGTSGNVNGTGGNMNGTGTGRQVRPVTALVHIGLADLATLPGATGIAQAWAHRHASMFAGENARTSIQPGYGGAWLTGDEARTYTAGASITPVVTARPDASVLPDLAAAGARLHALLQDEQHGTPADPQRKHGLAADLLGHAIKALSGPTGFASWLRTRLLAGTVLGSGSLVLDVGRQRAIPRQLRITIAIRDRTCSWPGCDRPATTAEPHHVIHYADGGHTSPDNLKTYCWAHHHGTLHQHGWTGTMHPDGTTDLYRPDGTRYTPGQPHQPPQLE